MRRPSREFVAYCLKTLANERGSDRQRTGYAAVAARITAATPDASDPKDRLSRQSANHLGTGRTVTKGVLARVHAWMEKEPELIARLRAEYESRPGPCRRCPTCLSCPHRTAEGVSPMISVLTSSGFFHLTPVPPLVGVGARGSDRMGLLPGLISTDPAGGLVLSGISRQVFEAERRQRCVGLERIEPLHRPEEFEDVRAIFPGDGISMLVTADGDVGTVADTIVDIPIAGRLWPMRSRLHGFGDDATLAAVLGDFGKPASVVLVSNLGQQVRMKWRSLLDAAKEFHAPAHIFDPAAGERVASCFTAPLDEDVLCVSLFGHVWRIAGERLRPRLAGALGVNPIKLEGADRIVFAGPAPKDAELICVHENGFGTSTRISSFKRLTGDDAVPGQEARRGQSLIAKACAIVGAGDELVIVSRKQRGVRVAAADIIAHSREARRPVRLMDLDTDDGVVGAVTIKGA